MAEDRTGIGLTAENQRNLEALLEKGWFADGQEIARFALAYAIDAGIEEGETKEVETRWSMGTFDSTGELREIVTALYPDVNMPVRFMQHLVNEGLTLIHEVAGRTGAGPSDLLATEPGS